MIKITRIGHVNFRVTDKQKAKDFYMGILGLKFQEEDPDHPHGGTHLQTQEGPDLHTLDFGQHKSPDGAQRPQPDQVGLNHIAFKVATLDDLKEAYSTLLDNDVVVRRVTDHTSQLSVYFNDPDGNGLEIYFERENARALYPGNRGDKDVELPVSKKGEPLPAWYQETWPPAGR